MKPLKNNVRNLRLQGEIFKEILDRNAYIINNYLCLCLALSVLCWCQNKKPLFWLPTDF